MGGTLLGSTLTEVTSKSLGAVNLSINPLELLSAARLVIYIWYIGLLPKEVKTVVLRVNNASAYACINMGRALSSTTRCALRVLGNTQQAYQRNVIPHHVLTDDNVVAD